MLRNRLGPLGRPVHGMLDDRDAGNVNMLEPSLSLRADEWSEQGTRAMGEPIGEPRESTSRPPGISRPSEVSSRCQSLAAGPPHNLALRPARYSVRQGDDRTCDSCC